MKSKQPPKVAHDSVGQYKHLNKKARALRKDKLGGSTVWSQNKNQAESQ